MYLTYPHKNDAISDFIPTALFQECCKRASDLFGPAPESITPLPLELFPGGGGGGGGVEAGATAGGLKGEGDGGGKVMKTYAGIVSIAASICVVFLAVCVWIMTQLATS